MIPRSFGLTMALLGLAACTDCGQTAARDEPLADASPPGRLAQSPPQSSSPSSAGSLQAPASPSRAAEIVTVPKLALVEQLRSEIGAGGPVAFLPGDHGLVALSADGKRRRILVPEPTRWLLVDNRAQVLWFGLAGKQQNEIFLLDLLAREPAREPIAKGGEQRVGVVYEDDRKRRESLSSALATYDGEVQIVLGAEPRIDASRGVYGEIFDHATRVPAPLTAQGAARLRALRERGRGRPLLLPVPKLPRVDAVPPEACDDKDLCGRAEPVGEAGGFWRVLVAQACGDACQVAHQLYDPKTKEFLDATQPGRRANKPLQEAPPLDDLWISRGGAIIRDGELLLVSGERIVDGNGLWGGGWLDAQSHLL
jgi:hypothetical protein